MTYNQDPERLRLRPHHILCESFSPWSITGRGETFNEVERRIRDTLTSGTGSVIEVVEGVDDLCEVCPLCRGGRCQSSLGNEVEVRKWDANVLKGLGISYGDRMTAETFRQLIGERTPLPFCQTKCRLREGCNVFRIR